MSGVVRRLPGRRIDSTSLRALAREGWGVTLATNQKAFISVSSMACEEYYKSGGTMPVKPPAPITVGVLEFGAYYGIARNSSSLWLERRIGELRRFLPGQI